MRRTYCDGCGKELPPGTWRVHLRIVESPDCHTTKAIHHDLTEVCAGCRTALLNAIERQLALLRGDSATQASGTQAIGHAGETHATPGEVSR